jgi:hypothetical protein
MAVRGEIFALSSSGVSTSTTSVPTMPHADVIGIARMLGDDDLVLALTVGRAWHFSTLVPATQAMVANQWRIRSQWWPWLIHNRSARASSLPTPSIISSIWT